MDESCAVKALARAVKVARGQSPLATRVNALLGTRQQWRDIKPITQGHIWSWLHRTGRVPCEYATPIEIAVNQEVRRHELCPSVFDPPAPCACGSEPGAPRSCAAP